MDSERTVATALAGYLRQAGVTRVFGYPGESVVDFMEAARDGGPAIIAAVREASAAFMAEGAAMRTGGIGTCLSTLGPGSTALLNGVASATLDRVPMLAISGQVESSREQYWTHQLVDQGRLFAPVTKLAARLEPGSADTVLRRALRTATAERPGAVHLTVTTDTFGMTMQGGGGTVPPLGPATGSPVFYGGVDFHGDEPLRQLRDARRPVLLAGGGAVRCGAEAALAELAARAAAPAGTVMTTDVGSHKIMAGQAWTAYAPRETLITNGLSAMGFGLPAAIGAAVSGPGPVVCLAGDGGFGMTATELAVAARLGLGLVVVVFSDGSLNRIELHQAAMGYPLTATAVDRVDIPVLAESLGCDGVRVESVSGLEKALSTAFSGRVRPLVIEARIDTSQYAAQY